MSSCEDSWGNTDVHMGGNLADVCRGLLLVSTADISIPQGNDVHMSRYEYSFAVVMFIESDLI